MGVATRKPKQYRIQILGKFPDGHISEYNTVTVEAPNKKEAKRIARDYFDDRLWENGVMPILNFIKDEDV